MRGNRVLITGGSGDLGRVVAPLFISAGGSVLSLDPVAPERPVGEWVVGSILDRGLVDDLVSRVDIVIHIAAWHGIHAFTQSKSSQDFWDLNTTGTFNLLDACARHSVRKFIFISSTSVDEWPDMYGVTKALGEELCRSYARRHAMQILALRPRAFIPWWNRKVYSSKEEWARWFARGAVHIDDVARAIIAACGVVGITEVPYFETVELDGKHDFSEAEIEVWRRTGTTRFLSQRFPDLSEAIGSARFLPSEPPTYKDLGKARALLGYEPSYGLEELLREMSKAATTCTPQ